MVDLLRKLSSFLAPRERHQFLGVLCGMVLAAGLEAVGLGILLAFILILRDGGLPSAGQQVTRVLEAIGATSGPGALTRLSLLVLVFYVAKNVYLGWLYRVEFKIVYKKQTDLSKRLLRTYLDKPYTFHLQRNTAELLKNVTDEVHAACHNVLVPLLLLISEAMVIAVIVGTLMVVDPLVTVSVLALTAGAGWMVMARVRRTLKAQGQAKQDHFEAMIKWINQSFGSLKEIKILGRQGSFVELYGVSAAGFGNSFRFIAMAHQLPRLVIETLAVGFIALTVVLSQWQRQEIASILPLLALFGLAAVRLMPSMGRVASMLTMFQYFKPAVDVVYRDLDRPAAGSSSRSPAVTAHPPGGLPVMRLKAELALAGVAYHYPGTERLAVEDVSLVIRKGALVGLVGPSGSGKTTILDLTLGLLTPSGGRLLVDGQDIHEDLRAWQANIGYVPQIAYILDDSIRRNVALGVADTEIDDDRVWWALHAAQLESFVTSLPRRLDTIVGERGSRVSGGERQRLGIARALYHDPDVLVMDEPTSALDYATEHEVLRVIDAMKGQKTMLVVAHRLSTVRSCDEIYMVRHGGVSGPLQYENVAALAQAGGDVR